MDDPAYKRLLSRPRMVRDLLSGFAARDWNAQFDLGSLTPLSASYVSHDLRQRHGDLVWRLRFRAERWLYVVLLLEFESAVDRSMAVCMLTYTALLYQKLFAEGVLRERSGLPPVLPVVIYNGRRPWTAPVDVAELIASGSGAALARSQVSQRCFLLGEARVGPADLPSGNLLLARLLALGVDPVTERVRPVTERVHPVPYPAVVPCDDPPDAQQYSCDHAHGATTVGMLSALSFLSPLGTLGVRCLSCQRSAEWHGHGVAAGSGPASLQADRRASGLGARIWLS